MNKHELKSLLENIYTTLTEADIPDNPPAPEGYNPLPQEPWPWPPNPLSTTPPPPPPPIRHKPTSSRPLPPNGPPPDPYPRYYVRGFPPVPIAPPIRHKPNSVVGPNNPPDYLDLWQTHEYMDPWEWLDNNPLGTPGNPYNKHFLEPPYVENNSMNKQELKSLLENIYHLLAEAPGENEYKPDPNFVGPPHLNPPYIPDISDRRNPGHQPAPKPPPMPLDKNGNPQFPSQRFWEQLWRAQRRVPPGGTQNDYPNEFAEILRLDSILRAWEQQQQQQPPDDGGTLG